MKYYYRMLFTWVMLWVTTWFHSTVAAQESYRWNLPKGFPLPLLSDENPITPIKVKLGRYLFYDPNISANQTMSCGSCHQQDKAFTDGKVTPTGSTGEVLSRNSMSLTNVTYNSVFNWANPLLKTLSMQALIPLSGEFPVELGWAGHEEEILQRFRRRPTYQKWFVQAFPGQTEPITQLNITRALAAFISTLISGNAAYDQSVYQSNPNALSESAKRGQALFFSERLECFHCHGGFNFTQSTQHDGTMIQEVEFHNNGLYNLGGTGAYPLNNRGLWDFTFKQDDMGRFRAPTLRNIELTAPYMHDGSIATLEEVIDHYSRSGRNITSGALAGDGRDSPYKSPLIVGFLITPEEKADVINFLKSLTDWSFICNPNFSDPFGRIPPHATCADQKKESSQ